MNTVELIFHSGPQQGQKLMFRMNATLGREPINTIVLDDPSCSSRHCKIFNDDGNTVLKDLRSTNGTFVNGEPIGQIELHSGDMIVIGETRIEVQLTPVPTDKPAPPVEAPAPESGYADHDFAHVDVSRRSFSTEPNVSEVVVTVEAAPSPLDSESKAAGAPLPQDAPHRLLTRPAMFPKWSGNPKSKIILAVTCGLALLLGVGFGLRYALRSKPQNAAQPTKPVVLKPKPKPEPTWNDILKTFKPEGDKNQQAKQRIAFLKKLIRRFPAERANRVCQWRLACDSREQSGT